ncbi:hypothetical protein GCM10017556_38630 [Micromonospora sagamiensis]|nr:hypothetical protein GCM10017556_38630 [Micromonospora sagamiensis]
MASETPGCPLSAYDTAPLETPARRATSAMVGRFTGASLHFPGARTGGFPSGPRADHAGSTPEPPEHPRYRPGDSGDVDD